MKLYTKTGDGGETALFDGTRVPKCDQRVTAYGDIDELNAILGSALSFGMEDDLAAVVLQIQRDLFAVGARLADPRDPSRNRAQKTTIGELEVRRLEDAIDRYEAELSPLQSFLLPGGNRTAATFHIARSVCRRAERNIVAIDSSCVPSEVLKYVNRLSDLLFVLARVTNRRYEIPEQKW